MQILYIYFTTYTCNFVCKDVLNVDTKISKKWRFSDDSSGSLLSGFNWDLYMFGQSSKKEKLDCPLTIQRVFCDAKNAYKKFATNIKRLQRT